MNLRSRRLVGVLGAGSILSTAPLAMAAPLRAVAPGHGGQPALVVQADATGVTAAVCARAPCDGALLTPIALPESVRPRAPNAELTVVRMRGQRRAIVARIAGESPGEAWQAIVAAAPGAPEPRVIFAGFTGLIEGEPGERRGPAVVITEKTGDGRDVLVGVQRESFDLCGRPALLAPKVVWSEDLSLRPVKLQRLGQAERAAAPRLVAERQTTPGVPRFLMAQAATSAVGSPQALTDGDLETAWAEGRGGSGRGEFAVLRASTALPIHGFELVIRPPTAVHPHGTGPRELWFATRDRLFGVDFTEDPFGFPGALYRVKLPEAVHSDCVAVVSERAFDESATAELTIAEVGVLTEVDPARIGELVAALAGDGEAARTAAVALSLLGRPAMDATAAAFADLPATGKRLALDVLDEGPCEIAAAARVLALASEELAPGAHTSLGRCGAASVPALLEALSEGHPARAHAVHELAALDPATAARALLPLLGSKSSSLRAETREALGQAAAADAARPVVLETLARIRKPAEAGALDAPIAVDFLRAMAPLSDRYREGLAAAAASLLASEATFRTRYLTIDVIGRVASADRRALALLDHALRRDATAEVRAAATRTAERAGVLADAVLGALSDPGMRVRLAAVEALGESGRRAAASTVMARLAEDEWPLVRAAAARALGGLGPSPEIDAGLARALTDDSPNVRRPAAMTLGRRRARAEIEALVETLKHDDDAYVRSAAATSLGQLCARSAAGELESLAEALLDLGANEEARVLGRASLLALSRMESKGIDARLKALENGRVSPFARVAAGAARSVLGECKKNRARP